MIVPLSLFSNPFGGPLVVMSRHCTEVNILQVWLHRVKARRVFLSSLPKEICTHKK